MERELLIATVLSAQQGQEEAFAQLFDAYSQDLYYYIYKTLGDSDLAEDLTQDTFLDIFQKIGQLNEPAAFVTWAKQIAHSRCTAWFRKRHELLADEDEDGYSVFDTQEEDRAEFIPHEALDKEELKKTLHAMISQLPAAQRSALLLRYFDELSVEEIAKIQNVSTGTVKSRLNYGRQALKSAVESYEKKSGVKLRCAGVVPLLLWLFRDYALANGISLTAAGSAVYAAPAAAKGLKAAGFFTAKKIIAAIAAAAVVGGGIIAGVVLSQPKAPQKWEGYGDAFYQTRQRFDVQIREMDEDSISGSLEISRLFESKYQTDFEGSGTAADGKILYTLTFAQDTLAADYVNHNVPQMTAIYDPQAQTLAIEDMFRVVLRPQQETPAVAENITWSGRGVDQHLGMLSPEHRLEITADRLTQTQLEGNLSIYYRDQLVHQTQISGQGFTEANGIAWYEVRFHTPKEPDSVLIDYLENFWLYYDPQSQDCVIVDLWFYDVELEKII